MRRAAALSIFSLLGVGALGCAKAVTRPPSAGRHDAGAIDGATRHDAGVDGGRPGIFDAEVDGGVSIDTGVPFDAQLDSGPPACEMFVFGPVRYDEVLPIGAVTSIFGCRATNENFALVEIAYTTCFASDSPGPVLVHVDVATRVIELTPLIWRQHGPDFGDGGMPPGYVHRAVRVSGLGIGDWTVRIAGGTSTARLTVIAGGGACLGTAPDGDPCAADCDCEPGLTCLPVEHGVGSCIGDCHHACNVELDCPPNLQCADDAVFASPYCTPLFIVPCPADCPAGRACVTDPMTSTQLFCEWTADITAASLHACTDNADCDPGFQCVQDSTPGATGIGRTCQIPCESREMRCPSGYQCGDLAAIQHPYCSPAM